MNQARAALESARLNLSHTVITSPISGTIISRNVDRGQTVAASFSSPTLFEIGEDLTKMRVNASIDEADVAKLRVGMSATFTVDAYPEEAFEGRLNQIRLAASTVQNVVTYDAIIEVSNPQLRLKPGMTANVKILIRTEKNVLKLPNAPFALSRCFRKSNWNPHISERAKRNMIVPRNSAMTVHTPPAIQRMREDLYR